jgi:hypothetical protein
MFRCRHAPALVHASLHDLAADATGQVRNLARWVERPMQVAMPRLTYRGAMVLPGFPVLRDAIVPVDLAPAGAVDAFRIEVGGPVTGHKPCGARQGPARGASGHRIG